MLLSSKIFNFAFYSRILVFLMQVLFNAVIPDHDAKIFHPPSVHKQGVLDNVVEFLVAGFRRWDGIYFHHISEHGYTYENTLVFFPLFPLTVRALANTLLLPLQFLINYSNTLTVAAFLVNLLLFVKSAQLLYQLSLRVLQDERLAFKAAQLYCINPASIFFSACYSETMFAYFTFQAMLQIEKERQWKGSLLCGLSALTRSNGIVNTGFVLYRNFTEAIRSFRNLRNAEFVGKMTTVIAVSTSIYLIVRNLLLQLFLCFLPFFCFQGYAYHVFCTNSVTSKDMGSHIVDYGNKQGYKMPHTGISKWCNDLIPYSYSYVQSHHWGVGFMNYWTFTQIPNFILATPIILLSVWAIVYYVYNNFRVCLTLGLSDSRISERYKKTDVLSSSLTVGFHQRAVFVYVAELAFLLLFGTFFMHIQVLTRFLCSSSPVLYWLIACVSTPPTRLSPPSHNPLDVFAQLRQPQDSQPQPATDGKATPTASNTDPACSADQHPDTPTDGTNSPTPTRTNPPSSADLDDLYDWNSSSWLLRAVFIYMHLYFFVGIAAFSNSLPWT